MAGFHLLVVSPAARRPTEEMAASRHRLAGERDVHASHWRWRRTGGSATNLQVNSDLIAYLEAHAMAGSYLFATTSSMTASAYIIATGKPVMALGGFSGSDPDPDSSADCGRSSPMGLSATSCWWRWVRRWAGRFIQRDFVGY